MNKLKLSKIAKSIRTTAIKKSPEILTGIGVAGMVTTTVLAVKATPKALKLIDAEKLEVFDNLDPKEIPGNNVDYRDIKLKPIEVIKVAWKPYIPAAVTGVVSLACLICASSANARRNATLAAAYKISETALTEYREKVVETIGENKDKTIREKIAKDRIEQNPVSKNNVIVTKKGSTLCYDSLSGRYFESDIDLIRRVENNLNRRMIQDDYISLNEFYSEIGLEYIDLGNDLGWNVSKGLIDIYFGSQLTDDGRPCVVLEHGLPPQYNYSKFA